MKLGRYRLLSELGRGGMGIIHLAQTTGPGGFEKLVALKELRPELATSPEHRDMFLEEARLGARLAHPNIVDVHEVGCEGGRWFMALELVDGCSFARARPHLPARLAVRVLCELLAALHHAHELGVVHRDVSAQNVLLGYDGRVKLLDFGVAKANSRRTNVTKEGVVKGSVQYMSPDHVASVPIDRRADIFAVGVLLREVLTGERLWPNDLDDLSIVRRLIAGDVPPFPPRAWASSPRPLVEVVKRAMHPDRAQRFATAEEMRSALQRWLSVEDPNGSLAGVAHLLRDVVPPRMTELPSEALETASVTVAPLEKRGPARKRLLVAAVAIAALGLVACFESQGEEQPIAMRPTPRAMTFTRTMLDATPRPAVLRPPPVIDRYDPGY